ncbi:MAG: hypothetical protein H6712_15990, partial [Myxococcales bacterium]|nr:hypothetical protein [Myxococcales bacterium]
MSMYEKISIGFAVVWFLGGTAFLGAQLLSAPTGAQTVAATVRLWLLVISPALLNGIIAAALWWSHGPPRVAASIWLAVLVVLQLGALAFFVVVRADARARLSHDEAEAE